MNLQDLNFIKIGNDWFEQYDVRLDDGTLVGTIRYCWRHVECYPTNLDTQSIRWNKKLFDQDLALDHVPDDILIKCGQKLCNYHNELAFLEIVLSDDEK